MLCANTLKYSPIGLILFLVRILRSNLKLK
jgi:hypothetical protein